MQVTEDMMHQAMELCEQGTLPADLPQEQYELYLEHVGSELLTEDDQRALDYVLMSLWTAMQGAGMTPSIDPAVMDELSDQLWKEYEVSFDQDLSAYINHCFQECEEEEMLALIEDSLPEDDAKEPKALFWMAAYQLVMSAD